MFPPREGVPPGSCQGLQGGAVGSVQLTLLGVCIFNFFRAFLKGKGTPTPEGGKGVQPGGWLGWGGM